MWSNIFHKHVFPKKDFSQKRLLKKNKKSPLGQDFSQKHFPEKIQKPSLEREFSQKCFPKKVKSLF